MKKIMCVLIPIIIIVLGIGVCFGISIIKSPEYALMQIANDIKESGVEGLMPHLTEDAKNTVSSITAISENKVVSSILSFLGKDDCVGILKSNLKDIEWNLDDVLKGKNNADVVVKFNYKEKLVGTVKINMIQENGDWKIRGIDIPDFEKIDFAD